MNTFGLVLNQHDAAIRRQMLTPVSRWIRSAKALEKNAELLLNPGESK